MCWWPVKTAIIIKLIGTSDGHLCWQTTGCKNRRGFDLRLVIYQDWDTELSLSEGGLDRVEKKLTGNRFLSQSSNPECTCFHAATSMPWPAHRLQAAHCMRWLWVGDSTHHRCSTSSLKRTWAVDWRKVSNPRWKQEKIMGSSGSNFLFRVPTWDLGLSIGRMGEGQERCVVEQSWLWHGLPDHWAPVLQDDLIYC